MRRPVATSIPQTSWPNGLGGGPSSTGCPLRNAFRSVPSVSATSTCRSTSPSAGIGSGTSSRRRSPGPWKPQRPHGVKTTFSASRLRNSFEPLPEPIERQDDRLGDVEVMEQRERLVACTPASPIAQPRRSAPTGRGRRRDLAGVREDEHGAARGDRLERRRDATRPPKGRPRRRARPAHVRPGEDRGRPRAPASPRRSRTSPRAADEAVAHDEHAPARNPRRSPGGRRRAARPSSRASRASPPGGRPMNPHGRARRSRRAGSSTPETARRSTRAPRGNARTLRTARGGRELRDGRPRARRRPRAPAPSPHALRRASRRPTRRGRSPGRARGHQARRAPATSDRTGCPPASRTIARTARIVGRSERREEHAAQAPPLPRDVGEDVRPPVLARPEGTRRHGRRVRGRQGGVATTEPGQP